MLDGVLIRAAAIVMTAVAVLEWIVWSRAEQPGRSAPLRLRYAGRVPRLVRFGGDSPMLVILFYPAIVAIVPSLSYGTFLQWSFPFDEVLQVAGLALWAVGAFLLTSSSHVIARYLSVNGVAVDQELVTTGPYAYIRHPFYAAFMFLGVGILLAFESYVLIPFVALNVVSGRFWAREEDRFLASPEGFGDAYRAYMGRTGRLLPRLRT